MRFRTWVLLPALLAFVVVAAPPANVADLKSAFQKPPDDARIMMRWWWFGPAVTKPQIERELRRMKEGGIGGVEVQAVYPIALDDPGKGFRNLPFLSSEFLDALKFTAEKTRELGLRMDVTIGSGWPYGGPQVPITEAAGRLRVQKVTVGSRRVPVPDIGHGEALIAAFDDTHHGLPAPKDGILWLPEGSDTKEVQFFVASRTGMMVKRPAVGAEGFVVDHYDRSAIDHYLKVVGDPMMRALGADAPYAAFCDSFEVFGSDWTGDLLAEFQKRRGYDLKPYLPALVSDIGPKTAAIRHDWGRTLTELVEDRFMKPMQAWAQANKTRFRVQGYGMPPATVSSNALADLPEGEGAQWKVVRAVAVGVFGKPPIWEAGHIVGDVDLASLPFLPRDAARHQSRSRPSFSSRHQPADRARMALQSGGHRVSGNPLICRGRAQRSESLVDRDARSRAVSATCEFPIAAGPTR